MGKSQINKLKVLTKDIGDVGGNGNMSDRLYRLSHFTGATNFIKSLLTE